MIPKSEIRTKSYLKKHKYYFMRAGRSYGLFDFIASNKREILFIQTKCNQAPRKNEMERLMAFNNCPRGRVKKQIWIWKRYSKLPIIKEV